MNYQIKSKPIATSSYCTLFSFAVRKTIFSLLILLVAGFSFGQTGVSSEIKELQEEIEYQTGTIKQLRKELEETQKRIDSELAKEQSAAERVARLEKDISLVDRMISELRKEERKTASEISKVEEDIAANEARRDELQRRYAQRVVNTYKKGTLSSLESILSSTSWRQAVYRAKYLKIISDYDRQLYEELLKVISEIEQQKAALEVIFQKSNALKRDREKHVADLRTVRGKKQQELESIKNNRAELEKHYAEKEAGIKQMEDVRKKLMETRESIERAARIKRQQEELKLQNFAALKGKLPWPAEGRVVAQFGNQWNEKLKTRTQNPGIDIKGQPGSPIRCVKDGEITKITYIRGFGTTIFVDHGGGFYTVYSHVTNIQTDVDQRVEAGDILAYMGDSGSINGAKLHFEIWGEGRNLDPEEWLAK